TRADVRCSTTERSAGGRYRRRKQLGRGALSAVFHGIFTNFRVSAVTRVSNESTVNTAGNASRSSRIINANRGFILLDRCNACRGSLPSPGADLLERRLLPKSPFPGPANLPLVGGASYLR